MKKLINKILLLIIPVIFTGNLFIACDDQDSSGDPVIEYVRVTNPEQADSLLVRASMGTLIVLVGENLGGVVEVWFNDQQAVITAPYVTDNNIFVRVPSTPPDVVTNIITLVLSDGSTYEYPFEVTISGPQLDGILCEYIPAGGEIVLYGNYFFDPVVIFPGDVEGVVNASTSTQTELHVIVPEGAEMGQITITTLFGSTRSDFYFRDNRGMILDFDQLTGAGYHYHSDNVKSDDPVQGVSGNYYHLNAAAGNYDWNDVDLSIDKWGHRLGTPDPLWEGGTFGKGIRFEANVLEDWGGPHMMFIFMPYDNEGNARFNAVDYPKGLWRPYQDEDDNFFQTDGWMTFTIPLSEFHYIHNGTDIGETILYPDNCGSLSVFMFGPVAQNVLPSTVNICIDNIRVVDL